jgi:hypothetical protein
MLCTSTMYYIFVSVIIIVTIANISIMATLKNKQFETLFQGAALEADGYGVYNFYNFEDEVEFFFNYDATANEFIDKCDLEISESQLIKIENKILSQYKEDLNELAREPETPYYLTTEEEIRMFY